MTQSYETPGKAAVAGLATKQPQELLLLFGGVLAVLLSVVLYGLLWLQGMQQNQLAGTTTTFVVTLVLGAVLGVSSVIVRKNQLNGAIVAGVVSIVLIVYGGQAGTIGGLVGFFGAILAAVSPYMPWSKNA